MLQCWTPVHPWQRLDHPGTGFTCFLRYFLPLYHSHPTPSDPTSPMVDESIMAASPTDDAAGRSFPQAPISESAISLIPGSDGYSVSGRHNRICSSASPCQPQIPPPPPGHDYRSTVVRSWYNIHLLTTIQKYITRFCPIRGFPQMFYICLSPVASTSSSCWHTIHLVDIALLYPYHRRLIIMLRPHSSYPSLCDCFGLIILSLTTAGFSPRTGTQLPSIQHFLVVVALFIILCSFPASSSHCTILISSPRFRNVCLAPDLSWKSKCKHCGLQQLIRYL